MLAPQTDNRVRHSSSRICAKPPPTAGFDLEAIEAFEAELDLAESSDADFDIDTDDDAEGTVSNSEAFVVPDELSNKRIDAVVAALAPDLSRSTCGKLVMEGKVKDGDNNVLDKKSIKVPAGTVLRVEMPDSEKPLEIVAQDILLSILYEDEHMIVLNKAAGMVVHPAAGNWDGTVVNALAHYLATSPHGSGEFVGDDDGSSASKVDPTGADGETISFRPELSTG